MTKSIEPNESAAHDPLLKRWEGKTSPEVILPHARQPLPPSQDVVTPVDAVVAPPQAVEGPHVTFKTVTVCNGGSRYANLGHLTTYRVFEDADGVEHIHRKGYGLVKLSTQNLNIIGRS
jgi:hypothetical protein